MLPNVRDSSRRKKTKKPPASAGGVCQRCVCRTSFRSGCVGNLLILFLHFISTILVGIDKLQLLGLFAEPDLDLASVGKGSLEDLLRKGIFDVFLDGSTQGPCAERRIIPLIRQALIRTLGELDGD